ncbi:MAG: DUF559 domain-containing protein, partial [Bacteroidaceae bacterium]|nr:DUF559 domain-containing protein [Bacteroidaceae bacterium]
ETKSHEKDVIRSERLESLGFQILRFTNDEVFNNIEQVLTTIKKHLYEI